MYQVRSNGNGYSFETSNGSVYEVYFTKLDNLSDYFQKEIGTNDVYYFGIERITENKGGNDIFIKRTIAYIIITFFVSNPTAVLLFNYSNDNNSINAKEKFSRNGLKSILNIHYINFINTIILIKLLYALYIKDMGGILIK